MEFSHFENIVAEYSDAEYKELKFSVVEYIGVK